MTVIGSEGDIAIGHVWRVKLIIQRVFIRLGSGITADIGAVLDHGILDAHVHNGSSGHTDGRASISRLTAVDFHILDVATLDLGTGIRGSLKGNGAAIIQGLTVGEGLLFGAGATDVDGAVFSRDHDRATAAVAVIMLIAQGIDSTR